MGRYQPWSNIIGLEDGKMEPWDKENELTLESERGKETDSSLESPKGT